MTRRQAIARVGGYAAWTPERVQRLIELHGRDKSPREIANILGGTTRNAVIGKLYRIKKKLAAWIERQEGAAA